MMLNYEWDIKSVQFPLTEESVVVEIGGYQGRWAFEIAKRFNPYLHVFEPQRWAYDKCWDILRPYDHAVVYNYGLGDQDAILTMTDWGTDGCSFSRPAPGKPTGQGEMREIGACFKTLDIGEVDVCLMNIEGGEFTLIPHMLRTGVMDSIHYFMCQFHPLDEGQWRQYRSIRDQLGQKRLLWWDYKTALICWERL